MPVLLHDGAVALAPFSGGRVQLDQAQVVAQPSAVGSLVSGLDAGGLLQAATQATPGMGR